jgi:hypothetical protein
MSGIDPADHLCGFMGCKHPEAWHGEGGCIVPVVRVNKPPRYTADGSERPPEPEPCGCRWVDPIVAPLEQPHPIRDWPQA